MRWHANLPGPVSVSGKVPGSGRNKASGNGFFGWLFLGILGVALVVWAVKAAFLWWVHDLHWLWSTPLLIVALMAVALVYYFATTTPEERAREEQERQAARAAKKATRDA